MLIKKNWIEKQQQQQQQLQWILVHMKHRCCSNSFAVQCTCIKVTHIYYMLNGRLVACVIGLLYTQCTSAVVFLIFFFTPHFSSQHQICIYQLTAHAKRCHFSSGFFSPSDWIDAFLLSDIISLYIVVIRSLFDFGRFFPFFVCVFSSCFHSKSNQTVCTCWKWYSLCYWVYMVAFTMV